MIQSIILYLIHVFSYGVFLKQGTPKWQNPPTPKSCKCEKKAACMCVCQCVQTLPRMYQGAASEGIFSLLSAIYLFIYLFIFNQSSILYTSLYTCQSRSPNSAHHHPHPTAVFPPWCPYICSLHLCLNFCPANRFICTIFLGSTYMR